MRADLLFTVARDVAASSPRIDGVCTRVLKARDYMLQFYFFFSPFFSHLNPSGALFETLNEQYITLVLTLMQLSVASVVFGRLCKTRLYSVLHLLLCPCSLQLRPYSEVESLFCILTEKYVSKARGC